jgi:hypothetical protein
VSDAGDRCPDGLGGFVVRLRPELAASDQDPVEDADIVVREQAAQTAFGRGNESRVHAQQAVDHRVAAGLLSNLPDHRVERILPVLDPATGKSPAALARR